jgi:proteic killer suppression protein
MQVLPYFILMIRSFRSKALRRFAQTGDGSKLSVQNEDRLKLILDALDRATAPEQMNIPGLRFHGLKGQDKGRYSVWASGNRRITFGWDEQDAIDVDLEDYH